MPINPTHSQSGGPNSRMSQELPPMPQDPAQWKGWAKKALDMVDAGAKFSLDIRQEVAEIAEKDDSLRTHSGFNKLFESHEHDGHQISQGFSKPKTNPLKAIPPHEVYELSKKDVDPELQKAKAALEKHDHKKLLLEIKNLKQSAVKKAALRVWRKVSELLIAIRYSIPVVKLRGTYHATKDAIRQEGDKKAGAIEKDYKGQLLDKEIQLVHANKQMIADDKELKKLYQLFGEKQNELSEMKKEMEAVKKEANEIFSDADEAHQKEVEELQNSKDYELSRMDEHLTDQINKYNKMIDLMGTQGKEEEIKNIADDLNVKLPQVLIKKAGPFEGFVVVNNFTGTTPD